MNTGESNWKDLLSLFGLHTYLPHLVDDDLRNEFCILVQFSRIVTVQCTLA